MAILKDFFRIELKTATKFIGWVDIVLAAISIVLTILGLIALAFTGNEKEYDNYGYYSESSSKTFTAVVGVSKYHTIGILTLSIYQKKNI